jgi:phosphoribosylformylglycinamidine cyclo-ligase
VGATVDRGTWRLPAVFPFIAGHGGIGQDEMERVFNMGVGMVAVVGADDADRAADLMNARGVRAWRAGEVTSGEGARLVGAYRG